MMGGKGVCLPFVVGTDLRRLRFCIDRKDRDANASPLLGGKGRRRGPEWGLGRRKGGQTRRRPTDRTERKECRTNAQTRNGSETSQLASFFCSLPRSPTVHCILQFSLATSFKFHALLLVLSAHISAVRKDPTGPLLRHRQSKAARQLGQHPHLERRHGARVADDALVQPGQALVLGRQRAAKR